MDDLLLRILCKIFTNIMFNISDGSASTIALQAGSSYATVQFFGIAGGLVSSPLAGPIIDHVRLGTNYHDCIQDAIVKVNDFKIPFTRL